MLIIDKRHDYYDSALAYGVDRSIIYKRDEQFHLINTKIKFPSHNYNVWYSSKTTVRPFIIGFCGKLYHGFEIEYETKDKGYNCHKHKKLVYDIESLEEILKSIEFGYLKYFYEKPKKEYFVNFRKHTCESFFAGEYTPKSVYEIFYDHKVPVFVFFDTKRCINLYKPELGDYNLNLNPLLKDFSFQKVMDAVTCNQEIQMYISGVLGVGEKETVVPSDKSKIVKAGFDVKTSFRNTK